MERSPAGEKRHALEETPGKKGAPPSPVVFIDSLVLKLRRCVPLKHVLNFLQRVANLVPLSIVVEDGGSHRSLPAGRRCLSGRKRLGRLLCFLFSITPHWLQCILGYPRPQDIGGSAAPEEVKQSPLNPWGKGCKRKQEDVDLEEQQSWIEALEEDLPEEDEADTTYEPSKSETDSEEHRSKNETESDLEFEEKDGLLMLKESLKTAGAEEPEAPETSAQEQAEEPEVLGTCAQEQAEEPEVPGTCAQEPEVPETSAREQGEEPEVPETSAREQGEEPEVPETSAREQGEEPEVPETSAREQGEEPEVPETSAREQGEEPEVPETSAREQGEEPEVPETSAREQGTSAVEDCSTISGEAKGFLTDECVPDRKEMDE
ncbi:proline-, glutamic acid- and leucine-rich protein 1-like isoform X2 [Rhinatrema bivittatum]|uniref:proline-, glutamic acid- and leucine-rich protein 1-like isoform X2 n=1 Tax=Rhinatrema bivittatum TaxID=194408 RepID=UPI0011285CA7|nr:proline-, glutamic acid- and leucine-rich protein 1-like isoform X2 [Rhinatrema bivittatum]